MNKKLLKFVAVIAGVFLLTGGAAYASDDANPGDLLYPVDLAVESVQRLIITDPVKIAEFEGDVLAERIVELEMIVDEGDLEVIEGVVDVISEQEVEVKEKTRVMNEVCTGDNCDEGEMTRVVNRIETQNQEHIQVMEQANTKLQNEYSTEECAGTCGKLDVVIETFEDVNPVDVDVEETSDVVEDSGSGNGNN